MKGSQKRRRGRTRDWKGDEGLFPSLFTSQEGDKYYMLLVLNVSLVVGRARWCVCIYSWDPGFGKTMVGLEQANARPPVVFGRLGVDDNLIRKGVGVGGGNGRNVVLVSVDDGDDLVRRFFEGFGHGAADLECVYSLD